MQKKEGILIVHDNLTRKKVFIDLLDVRGVAKDFERNGSATVIMNPRGYLDVIESYEEVKASIYKNS